MSGYTFSSVDSRAIVSEIEACMKAFADPKLREAGIHDMDEYDIAVTKRDNWDNWGQAYFYAMQWWECPCRKRDKMVCSMCSEMSPLCHRCTPDAQIILLCLHDMLPFTVTKKILDRLNYFCTACPYPLFKTNTCLYVKADRMCAHCAKQSQQV
jgi:hypothetical protein